MTFQQFILSQWLSRNFLSTESAQLSISNLTVAMLISMEIFVWIGIVFCISQSAMFSGLNLAFFGISRLRLEIEAANGNEAAIKVLNMRQDSNYLLTTILWGNVSINVMLTLLSDSILAGVSAFLFSTIAITLIGEIFPQAYFSRNALKMASLLSPVLRIYQIILFPVAKPIAMLLDRWLGPEGITFFREKDLREAIKRHIQDEDAEVDHVEGIGAINFLEFDDVVASDEGELIVPASVIRLPVKIDLPIFPDFEELATDPFIQLVQASGKKWVIVINEEEIPLLVLDADGFLRAVLLDTENTDPYHYCHRPIIIRKLQTSMDQVIARLRVRPDHDEDDVIDEDIILVWGDEKRIITGADILGRLLRGITKRDKLST